MLVLDMLCMHGVVCLPWLHPLEQHTDSNTPSNTHTHTHTICCSNWRSCTLTCAEAACGARPAVLHPVLRLCAVLDHLLAPGCPAELQLLPSYVAVCERLCLRKLWEGIVDYCSRDEVWQALQHQPHKAVLTHLQQRHARLYTAVLQQRGRGGRAGAPVAVEDVADAALSLLGPARPAASRV